LHEFDPVLVAAIGQRGAVEVEHPLPMEPGAEGNGLLGQLAAGEPQDHQFLHPLSLPFSARLS
jgi:hypothetical protein